MTKHLNNYIKRLDEISPGVSPAVISTIKEITPKHFKKFNFKEHVTGLLLGNVQSGKTGQIFGLIASAADLDFKLFILLTTDNVYLHEQTFKRAVNCLDTFTVCGEEDEIRFLQSGMRKPALIILKKNTKVLQKWRNNFSSSGFCDGRALFIVDDEGDAASLNTKINKDDKSAINSHLENMKNLANSSIYIQVTATPQPILLQAKSSSWHPSFVHYFPPGKGYLGGDFFYSKPQSFVIRLTDDNELDDLRLDEECMTKGLVESLLSFLVSGSHILLSKEGSVCNFLIHPSVRIDDHKSIAKKIGGYLTEMLSAISEDQMINALKDEWLDLQKSKPEILPFDEINKYIHEVLNEEKIKIIVMNSKGSLDTDCSEGMNIIIGGNSLGRGVTFPSLQTVYYCRQSKTPQADTFWQHCRMFGYDRDRALMRVFIPSLLLKLFTDLNNGNRALIAQIANKDLEDISLLYPPGIKPTRGNVVDKDLMRVIVGGVNYFPSLPKRKYFKKTEDMMSYYDERKSYHEVDLDFLLSVLEKFESEAKSDWSGKAFINCVKALKANKSNNKAVLIIRRNRNISKGTGTLLSPVDRKLGDSIKNVTVLTMYRINGSKENGWDGNPLWIPNIKFPDGTNFFKVD